jgi:ABC-type transport system substrate-binding protein
LLREGPHRQKVLPKLETRQKLIVAQETGPLTMDAHHVIDSTSASIMEHMVEPLLDLTPKGDVVPKLAEKWQVSVDATEFTLKLKKGIKFHDGQPLNAEAVKVNFDRRIDPKAATKFYMNLYSYFEKLKDTVKLKKGKRSCPEVSQVYR